MSPSTEYINETTFLIKNADILPKLVYILSLLDKFFRDCTVGSKVIRALAIMLVVFLWFDCQFLSSHACYKQCKA